MIGAIFGDIIGSIYEVNNSRTTEFDLFKNNSHVSDDSVLTIAVADALLYNKEYFDCYRHWGRLFPNAGYGKFFKEWLYKESSETGKSFGNGAAMRVSPVAWFHNKLEDVLSEAERSALPTHGHPEAIKGAKAIASSVFLARTGSTKDQIHDYVKLTFNYDLSKSLDWLRANNKFDSTAPGSVPEAITVFLASSDYENTIRNAISIGGDTDTIACMSGAIAEAFYKKIPKSISEEGLKRLPIEFSVIVEEFKKRLNPLMFG
jgi:ADP-ribosylglycohydrolase